MQSMRPMLGNELRDASSGRLFVRDGQRADGHCLQVHYLKGYFLLRHLRSLVDGEAFATTLRRYVHDLYHGRLVHSTDFLALYCGTFAGVATPESICHEWLDPAGVPPAMDAYLRLEEERISEANR